MKKLPYALCMLALMCGCRKQPQTPASQQAHTTAEQPTNRVEIPTAIRQNLGITFAKVERRAVASTIRVPGAFELQPRARHEYRMTLPGRVQLAVDQFQQISIGDLLYRFQSPQWPELQHEIIEGEQNIAATRAQIDVAQAKLSEAQQKLQIMTKRLEALAAADFKQADLEAQAAELKASVPRFEAELYLARTHLKNAERTFEHALHRASSATGIDEKQLERIVEHEHGRLPTYRTIDWIEVRATETGIVEHLAVPHGSYVEPPTTVLSTVDPTRLRFRAMGMQSDLPRLSNDSPSRIAPPRSAGLDLNDAITAQLTIGLEAHPNERTITLFAKPQTLRPWIRPGVAAFLEIEAESSQGPTLAIPRSAIVRDGIQHVFFRRDPQNPNQAIRVEADMGVSDGRWVALNSGVAPNDEVVLNGAYELMLATQQSGVTQKGGHFHADGSFHDNH